MPNANSAVAHRWFEELWNQGKIETIDELSTPDAIGHGQIEHDGQIDMEQFRVLFNGIRSAFPDIRFTIEQTVAEGDMVVLRWRAKASHKSEFVGTTATNRPVEFTGMSMMKIVDGKIVRGWDNWEPVSSAHADRGGGAQDISRCSAEGCLVEAFVKVLARRASERLFTSFPGFLPVAPLWTAIPLRFPPLLNWY